MSAPPTDHRWVSSWIAVGTFAIAAFILASAFVGASGPDGRVHGLVTDAVTSAPVTVAGIFARHPWWESGRGYVNESSLNSSGYYEMNLVPDYYEIMTHNVLGYASYDYYSVYVGSGQILWYNISLAPNPMDAWINGTVLDGSTSASIAGATIAARVDGTVLPSVVSNATGFYNIPLSPDDYVVRASAPGYTTWTTWVFSFSTDVVWTNATLWPIISRVSGYLVDSLDGSHVPGLGVTAIDSRAGYSTYGVADATGFFSFAVPPSPAISVAVYGQAPYAGNIAYVATHPHATTWVNITLDRLNAQIEATVTDALTGLPISGASVYAAWYYGSDWGTSNATGAAVIEAPAGPTTYVSAWASRYLIWSTTLSPVAGANSIAIRLYPDLPLDVRIRGHVNDSTTGTGLWPATVHVSGYDDQTAYGYTDGTGYYEVWTVAAPQTVRVTATGYAAGEAAVNPGAGATIWVNLSLSPDTNAPLVRSFTATPSIGAPGSNPTSLVADVNETSLEQSYMSILKLHSASANVGTFLNLGRLDPAGVSVTSPSAGNYTISTSWDTRTPIGHMSDGLSSVWWPSLYAYAPFQSAVAGYWDNATLLSPTPGAAVFDTRSGQLLYVYTSYGFFGPQDQPASTFSPYATGLRIDLTTAAIVGYALVNGPTFTVGNLRMDLSQAVPAGQYGALLEVYDSAGHYTSAATLMRTIPDTVPAVTPPSIPVASPFEGASVPGSVVIVASATDNTAVVRVEFFVDGVSVGNDTTAPFQRPLAAGSLKDGNHTLMVIAYDEAGNSASSVRHVTAVNVPGGLGLGPFAVGGLIVILAVVAAVGVLLILILRRRPRRPSVAPPVAAPAIALPSEPAPAPTPPAPISPEPQPPLEEFPDIDNL